jgi:hypothetical protein
VVSLPHVSLPKTTVHFQSSIRSTQWRTWEGEGVRGFKPPSPKFRNFYKAETISQFHGIYIHNNIIRIQVSFICKSSGDPDYGASTPNPHSLCPLSKTEFVEPPSHPPQIPGITPPPPKIFLNTLLETHVYPISFFLP